MTIEHSNTPLAIEESAIRQVAEATIKTTMDRHGITDPAQLKPEVIERAYEHAREKLTADAERAADPNYQQRLALEEENRVLRMQNEALKSSRPAQNAPVSKTVDPSIMAQKLGPLVWNHQLDGNGRLQACGIDPSLNTAGFRQEILDTLGPGSSIRGAELARTNHARYTLLKHAGKALRII